MSQIINPNKNVCGQFLDFNINDQHKIINKQ